MNLLSRSRPYITRRKANRENLGTDLEISNTGAINCTKGSYRASYVTGERLSHPVRAGRCGADPGLSALLFQVCTPETTV